MLDQQKMRLDFMETSRRFGFGPEVMKQTKVCRVCGNTCDSNEAYCFECGAILPRETLFDLYKSYHPYCPGCGTVVSSRAQYCPECGKPLRKRRMFHGLKKANQKESSHGKE